MFRKKKKKKITKAELDSLLINFDPSTQYTISDTINIDISNKPKKKRRSFFPNGLAFGLLKFAVQKLIIKVPDDKKEAIIKSAGKFFILITKAVAEGSARVAADSIRNDNGFSI